MTDAPDWAAHFGTNWLEEADRIEPSLVEVDPLLLDAAGLRPGDVVLDVGCGRGPTAVAVSQRVAPGGSVVGLDLAEPLVAAAARRHPTETSGVTWMVGDAGDVDLALGPFDVVISRFGTLFFDDPDRAFANLHRLTKPRGRLALAVWQPRDRSEFHQRPLDVATSVALQHGLVLEQSDPAGGPFAFGRPEVMLSLLERSGWRNATFDPKSVSMPLPATASISEVVHMSMRLGSLAPIAGALTEPVRAAVIDAVTTDLATRLEGGVGALEGAIAIVTAFA